MRLLLDVVRLFSIPSRQGVNTRTVLDTLTPRALTLELTSGRGSPRCEYSNLKYWCCWRTSQLLIFSSTNPQYRVTNPQEQVPCFLYFDYSFCSFGLTQKNQKLKAVPSSLEILASVCYLTQTRKRHSPLSLRKSGCLSSNRGSMAAL